MKYFGIPAESLWSRVAACEDLKELARRLEKVEVDPTHFDFDVATQNGSSLTWVLENYRMLPEAVHEKIKPKEAEEQVKQDFDFLQLAEMNDALDAMDKNENALSSFGYDLGLLTNIWRKIVDEAYALVEAFPELKEKEWGRKSFANPDQKVSVIDSDLLIRLRTAADYFSTIMPPVPLPEFLGTDTWGETITKMEEFRDKLDWASSTQDKINQLEWSFRASQNKIPRLIEKHFGVKGFNKISFSEAASLIEELISAIRWRTAETENMKRVSGVLEEQMKSDWDDEGEIFNDSQDSSLMDPFEAHQYFKEELAKQQQYLAEHYPESLLNNPDELAAIVAARFPNN
ncbi:MAG: hypothetical protein UT32_C0046G0003 [Parcubacteria group bacterium GW2011_GWC2_39_14]|nr:MAG: hypothetical protein UT32_C0046G0003 [Parcubacteria group bacterium GW2011_GWC2_39_14]KKR55078.1 MAG: hypothetical protein UT91_C0005G0080 [Parcubacteria group bacterium GW2011_GWA2_40_23]